MSPDTHPAAPRAASATAQRRRRTARSPAIRVHAGHGERLSERLGLDRLAVAGEGEAVLGTIGTDDLARDHLEVPLVLPVPAAYIAAIQPSHDGAACLRHRSLRALAEMLVDDILAHAQRPIPDCARVLRSTHRQQLG